MKKLFSAALAVMLVLSLLSFAALAEEQELNNRRLLIFETPEAPAIDGVVEDGEYGSPIAIWPGDTIMQSRGDYAENIEAYFYMCYDAEYIYYAVVTECDEPHVAFNEGDHYIFNAHHVMTMLLPDDPTKMVDNEYVYPDASQYDWSSFYNAGYCYEWTMIYNSKKNASEATDHFGNITSQIKYATSSADGYDVYEVAIPWTAMHSKVQTTPLTGVEGTVFGFDCMLGLTDVGEGYNDANGNYVYFGAGYLNSSKDLRNMAIVTCGGAYEPPVEPESSDVSEAPDVSAPDESATEPTSDSGIAALAIIAVIAAAGIAVSKKSR